MITELSPAFAQITTEIDPKDFLLQKGSWVRFSPKWRSQAATGWYVDRSYPNGMMFEVIDQPVIVEFATSRIIPGSDTVDSGDYIDLTLGNTTKYTSDADWINIYPELEYVIYQTGIGLKDGHYMIHTYIPQSGQYIYSLGDTGMYPDVSDTTRLYLGPKYPEDTPFNSPLWFMYFVKSMPNIILRPFVYSGVDFEKVTIGWWINKCKVKLIERPSPDQMQRALYLPWYEELKGF